MSKSACVLPMPTTHIRNEVLMPRAACSLTAGDVQSTHLSGYTVLIMYNSNAYSAASRTSPLAVITVPRRDLTDRDVQIEILFCGVCHSDLHAVRDEWNEFMPTEYPIVPGHEIV